MNKNSKTEPELQIVLVLPDLPHIICEDFEDLKQKICNNEIIQAKYSKGNKAAKTLEETFDEFLHFWQENNILSRANFYTAKFKLEKKGVKHSKDFRLDDENIGM